ENAGGRASSGELRVLGQEPIAGMNRIDLRLARDPQNVRDVQIGLDGQAMAADEVRFIRLGPVQREAILLGVDRYRRQTQLARGAHDSDRDLAAIGNQESLYPPRHDRKVLKIVGGSDHTGSCAPEWRFRREPGWPCMPAIKCSTPAARVWTPSRPRCVSSRTTPCSTQAAAQP